MRSLGTRGHRAPSVEDLRWLMDIVWPERATATPRGSVKARAGDETYVVVPSISHPRFLVPLHAPAASAETLRLYNRMRNRVSRLARATVAVGLRMGLTQRVFRGRVVARSEGRDDSLLGYLQEAMGAPDLVMAVGLRKRGLLTKPVLQLFTPGGTPVGYAKIGWNEATRPAVQNEGAVLEDVIASGPTTFRVPGVLHRGSWRELDVCVVEPLPGSARRYGADQGPPEIGVLSEMARGRGSRRSALGESDYWVSLRRRLLDAAGEVPTERGDALRSFSDSFERRHGAEEIELGAWHGDLVPWNMAWSRSDLYVVDWEHGAGDVPVGLDVLHFFFQIALVLERRDADTSMNVALERSDSRLEALGVSPSAGPVLAMLHLAEIFLRAHQAARTGAPTSPRLYAPVLEAIAARAEAVGTGR